MKPYFTILIPYCPHKFRTEWHPTQSDGPFAVLSRGSFATETLAIEWAQIRLNGTPYAIRRIDPETEFE